MPSESPTSLWQWRPVGVGSRTTWRRSRPHTHPPTPGCSEINVHRYQGAFATYVLLGVMFAQGFELVAMVEPGAFQILGAPATYDTILPRLLYYSFTTLTTLGYGDITPIHPYARSLAVLESLVGVIYPAVLIARLVSLDVIDEQEARRGKS